MDYKYCNSVICDHLTNQEYSYGDSSYVYYICDDCGYTNQFETQIEKEEDQADLEGWKYDND